MKIAYTFVRRASLLSPSTPTFISYIFLNIKHSKYGQRFNFYPVQYSSRRRYFGCFYILAILWHRIFIMILRQVIILITIVREVKLNLLILQLIFSQQQPFRPHFLVIVLHSKHYLHQTLLQSQLTTLKLKLKLILLSLREYL